MGGEGTAEVTYLLKYDPGVEAVHDSLPQAASEDLSVALADACDDPYRATQPYGIDNGPIRMIVTTRTTAVVFVSDKHETISVISIDPLG